MGKYIQTVYKAPSALYGYPPKRMTRSHATATKASCSNASALYAKRPMRAYWDFLYSLKLDFLYRMYIIGEWRWFFTENNDNKKVDLKEVIKKKKQKTFIIRTIVVAVVAVAIVLVVVNWEKIIAPFHDIAVNAGKGGFPVELPGSTSYVMDSLGDNFYLLTDTYVYTFTDEGGQIASIQHGFREPSVVSGDKRLLVFDKNGKGFKVYSRNEEVYSKTLDDTIVFAAIGKNERSAVVTTASRYSNYLCVFNDEGKQIFRYASPTERIMQVCFSDDENYVYLTVVGEKNGEFITEVMCFDITKEQDALWRQSIGNVLPYSLECCPDGIYGVTENGLFLLNASDGTVKAQNTFSKAVMGIGKTKGERIIFFRDTAVNGQTAVVYNDDLSAKNSKSFSELSSFDVNGGVLYVLSGNKLTAYSNSLQNEKVYDLDDDYSKVKIIGDHAYLLGYNRVQRISL